MFKKSQPLAAVAKIEEWYPLKGLASKKNSARAMLCNSGNCF
jgi:hypothetical protein